MLYPPIKPYHYFNLKVSDLHTLYVEECGNPNGRPVFFIHGGPGGGLQDHYRQYFDPQFYRIVLFDQRGCGKSTPFSELKENTTWDLVEDIEKIRIFLKIEKFLIFGGSWGSTLSLAYASKYPENLTGLILRGIFLCRSFELNWFYEEGASYIFPESWKIYLSGIEKNEKQKMKAYYQKLTSHDRYIQIEAAKKWSYWEGITSKLIPDEQYAAHYNQDEFALAFARIECHYFMNKAFFPTDNYLLEHVYKWKHLPGVLVHGRYDVVCPVVNAYDLKEAWGNAELKIIPNAGHSISEEGILKELVQATEKFKSILN